MHNFWRLTSAVFIFLQISAPTKAESTVRIVGSTAVYTFATMVAERMGQTTKYKTPIVEATGTGGGIKIFCGGVGKSYPDIVNTSRPFTQEEKNYCKQNGVDQLLEIKIGYDGVVIAGAPSSSTLSLTRQDLSKALSEYVYIDGARTKNPYQTWDQVNPHLPHKPISVLGPTSTLATREVFEEKVIRDGCLMTQTNCDTTIREDGKFEEVAEHDNVVIQKLALKPKSIGFVSYGYYTQNPSKIKPIAIDGVYPSQQSIANNTYPLSRPLYIYVKTSSLKKSRAIQAFIDEFFSNQASGPHGYLIGKGLIPLNKEERKNQVLKIKR